MRTSKGFLNLANLRTMFGYIFEETEFTANAKISMQVSPCTASMHKFHTQQFHSVHPLSPRKAWWWWWWWWWLW